MSKELWESQLEINAVLDKRVDLVGKQLTAVTELAIAQGKMLAELAKLLPSGCTGKHCACQDGAM